MLGRDGKASLIDVNFPQKKMLAGSVRIAYGFTPGARISDRRTSVMYMSISDTQVMP